MKRASHGFVECTLFLLTSSFPYGQVEPFLETELRYLATRFSEIIVVPAQTNGTRRLVPDGVRVDTTLAESKPLGLRRYLLPSLHSLRTCRFYHEALAPRHLHRRLLALGRIVSYLDNAIRTYRWLRSTMRQGQLELRGSLFYTYWMAGQSMGVGLARAEYPGIRLISRAHRHDLYEEASAPPYLPFRKETIEPIRRLFAVSEHGRQYVAKRYPWAAARCVLSRLGVQDPGFTTSSSPDTTFRIVTCSSMIPVKRLSLLMASLRVLSQRRPLQLLEWHHLGHGPLYKRLEKAARRTFSTNVRWSFHGQLPNREVIEFYRTHHVDVFVNVSASEGIPVSIMEAQSCGIPVIATAVGGTPEIVSSENGILLDGDVMATQIADALERLILNPEKMAVMRRKSKQTWHSMYNAEVNYNAFVDQVKTLLMN